jgi:hypothetical protein
MSWNMKKWMMLGSLASAALLVPACSDTNRGAVDEEVAPVEMERGTGGGGDVGMGGTGDAFDTSDDVGTGGTGASQPQDLGTDGQGVTGSENKADDAPGRTQSGGQPQGH